MKYYRLLSMLPSLPEAPEPPPIKLEAFVPLIEEDFAERDRPLVLAMLGFIDCQNVEALLQDFDVFDERAPLSRAQIEERADLPPYLEEFLETYDSGAAGEGYAFDELWRGYFEYLVQLGENSGNHFLKDWAAFEIGLRDDLVPMRADATGEKADLRLSGVAVDEVSDTQPLLSALHEAPNPMEAERLLDTERLKKIDAFAGVDPFSTDAALAYLAALLILDRWDVGPTVDVAKMLEVFA